MTTYVWKLKTGEPGSLYAEHYILANNFAEAYELSQKFAKKEAGMYSLECELVLE